MSKILSLLCVASVAFSGVSLASAPAAAQRYDGHHRYNNHHRGYRHDRRWRRGHHDNHGDALAAGALGFILGAAIADSKPHRDYAQGHLHDQTWLSHCESKYRSFDRGSGTYMGFDGARHYCR